MKSLKSLLLALAAGIVLTAPLLAEDSKPAGAEKCAACCCPDKDKADCAKKCDGKPCEAKADKK